MQALAAAHPSSQQLWRLAVLSLERQGDAAAAVQQVLQAAEEVSPPLRQQLLAQIAEAAAEQQVPLDDRAAEELIAACAASGSEVASAALLELYDGMLAAGQRPSVAAHRAALAALLRQLGSQEQRGQEELDGLLRRLAQMLGQEAELAPGLTAADWDAVLAAAMRGSDVSLLAGLLTEHGSLLAAASRQAQWGALLQRSAAILSTRGQEQTADTVPAWAAAAEQAPATEIAPALQLALMAAHHTTGQELQDGMGAVLQALSGAGRTAEVGRAAAPGSCCRLCWLSRRLYMLPVLYAQQLQTLAFSWLPACLPACLPALCSCCKPCNSSRQPPAAATTLRCSTCRPRCSARGLAPCGMPPCS